MAGIIDDTIIHLPIETIEASSGFSLDIGGSVAKLVYRSKEDYLNGKKITPATDGKGPVHIVLFSREKLDDVIKLINEKCDVTRKGDEPCEVFTTGVGGNFFKAKLQDELNIRLKNLAEFDCFVKAFRLLHKITPSSDMYEAIPPEGIADAKRSLRMMKSFKEANDKIGRSRGKALNARPDEDDEEEEDEDGLPCLLVMCGSAAGFLHIKESGKFQMRDGTSMSGRFFLGLSSLLTGVKDFDELYNMMSRADGRSVDMYFSETVDKSSKTDAYSSFADKEVDNDMIIYPFGKATHAKREDLKDDDIVHSAFRVICCNVAQLAHISAANFGVKRLYFCGNMINSELARRFISCEVYKRSHYWPEELAVKAKFVRHGGHLGAIGAFIQAAQMPWTKAAESK